MVVHRQLPRKALLLHLNETYSQQIWETEAEALVCPDHLLSAQDQVLVEVLALEVEREDTTVQSQLGLGLSEDRSCLVLYPTKE